MDINTLYMTVILLCSMLTAYLAVSKIKEYLEKKFAEVNGRINSQSVTITDTFKNIHDRLDDFKAVPAPKATKVKKPRKKAEVAK